MLGAMIGRVSPDGGAKGEFSTRDFRKTFTKKWASELDLEGRRELDSRGGRGGIWDEETQ